MGQQATFDWGAGGSRGGGGKDKHNGSWREGDIHYCLCDKFPFGSHDREGKIQ